LKRREVGGRAKGEHWEVPSFEVPSSAGKGENGKGGRTRAGGSKGRKKVPLESTWYADARQKIRKRRGEVIAGGQ